MIIKNIALGFVIKIIASFDDALTRIPVIASITKTRSGKIAFSIGTLLSLTVALFIAVMFSKAVQGVPGIRYIIASLIFILAIGVYFDFFRHPKKKHAHKEIKKIKKISNSRFLELISAGFIISFLTILDDIIVMTPVFIDKLLFEKSMVIVGIYIATLLQVLMAIYFAEKIDKFKYKKQIASLSLIILSILIAMAWI